MKRLFCMFSHSKLGHICSVPVLKLIHWGYYTKVGFLSMTCCDIMLRNIKNGGIESKTNCSIMNIRALTLSKSQTLQQFYCREHTLHFIVSTLSSKSYNMQKASHVWHISSPHHWGRPIEDKLDKYKNSMEVNTVTNERSIKRPSFRSHLVIKMKLL